jgi:hypothetical protein
MLDPLQAVLNQTYTNLEFNIVSAIQTIPKNSK